MGSSPTDVLIVFSSASSLILLPSPSSPRPRSKSVANSFLFVAIRSRSLGEKFAIVRRLPRAERRRRFMATPVPTGREAIGNRRIWRRVMLRWSIATMTSEDLEMGAALHASGHFLGERRCALKLGARGFPAGGSQQQASAAPPAPLGAHKRHLHLPLPAASHSIPSASTPAFQCVQQTSLRRHELPAHLLSVSAGRSAPATTCEGIHQLSCFPDDGKLATGRKHSPAVHHRGLGS